MSNGMTYLRDSDFNLIVELIKLLNMRKGVLKITVFCVELNTDYKLKGVLVWIGMNSEHRERHMLLVFIRINII